MVSMTWSAGINDIVSNYESKTELLESTSSEANAGCDAFTRGAGTPIYVDSINTKFYTNPRGAMDSAFDF